MKSLIEKIFKREPKFNYVIAEYKPNEAVITKTVNVTADFDAGWQPMQDEMEIDKLYQSN